MHRLFAIAALLIVLAVPSAAHADSREWKADGPKNPSELVIWCTATATAGGDTYTMRNYAPLDDGFDTNRYAQRVFTDDVMRAMLFAFPTRHEIQRSDVKVTCGGER